MTTLDERIEAVIEAIAWGAPSATEQPQKPLYVPAVLRKDGSTRNTSQTTYATREEAIAAAEAWLANAKSMVRMQLVMPQARALRKHYGLPEDIA